MPRAVERSTNGGFTWSRPRVGGSNAQTTPDGLCVPPGSCVVNAPRQPGDGVVDFPGTVATKWVTNDSVVYRVTATLSASAPDTAQGQTTNSHIIRWEAQNQ